MDRVRIVALLSETAALIREDINLLNARVIKCECFGADVTQEQAGRMATRLEKIKAAISATGDQISSL